jgi:hypothetical protein
VPADDAIREGVGLAGAGDDEEGVVGVLGGATLLLI